MTWGRNASRLRTPADARAAHRELLRAASVDEQRGRPAEAARKRSMAYYFNLLAFELEAEATAAKRQVKQAAE